jgi:chromosome partitioning protein
MVLTLFNQKGGAGKSTLALSLAWELMLRKNRVLIADADPQETCLDTIAKAEREGRAAPQCERFGDDMHRVLPGKAQAFDWVIIDTPGRLAKVSRAALAVSDVALVPVRPSAPDAWALDETLALVSEAWRVRPELHAAIVLTQVRRTLLGAAASEGLKVLSKDFAIPLLEHCTHTRTAWEWALYLGKGVTEHEPDGPAAEELRGILGEVEKRFTKGKRR